MPQPTQSAVIVAVPEAEPVVGSLRAELDRAAGWGVPAHVTVLYPFLPPDRIDASAFTELAAAIRTVPAFDLVLRRTEWFDESVLWLAPDPDQPFRALTAAVWARFPDYPPYGGAHSDVIPHLTVGHDAPEAVLRAAAASIEPRLPVRARVRAAQLIQGSAEPGSWRTVAELPLGDGIRAANR